ncbi:hypothetical protein CapIbe_000765 [Capra ibex]
MGSVTEPLPCRAQPQLLRCLLVGPWLGSHPPDGERPQPLGKKQTNSTLQIQPKPASLAGSTCLARSGTGDPTHLPQVFREVFPPQYSMGHSVKTGGASDQMSHVTQEATHGGNERYSTRPSTRKEKRLRLSEGD